jgi:hypothetical protein
MIPMVDSMGSCRRRKGEINLIFTVKIGNIVNEHNWHWKSTLKQLMRVIDKDIGLSIHSTVRNHAFMSEITLDTNVFYLNADKPDI